MGTRSASLLLALSGLACSTHPSEEEPIPMQNDIANSAFDDVREHSFESNLCSPEVDDPEWRGIALNAPTLVKYEPGASDPITGAFARAIVCGLSKFDYDTLELGSSFLESILFVATDTETHETFSGRMKVVSNPSPSPNPREGLPPEETAGVSIGEFFNINLVTVAGLPERQGEYKAHASLGPYQSNVVTIQIEEQE